MKELEENKAVKPGQEEIRQIPTEKRKLDERRIPPGCKFYEMLAVPDPNHPDRPVLGQSAEGFDPELAEIREAIYADITTSLDQPRITIAEINLGIPVQVTGPIERGIRRRLVITPGNFYEVAHSAKAARKKIIKRFFNVKPSNDAQDLNP